MSADKQYWLFAGHQYYPKGGMLDFRMTGTIDECKRYFADHAEEISSSGGGYIDNWGQIVGMETLKIVFVGTNDHESVEWEAYNLSSY